MSKGPNPRESVEGEQRVITWRLDGKLHNRLRVLCTTKSTSINKLITNIMREGIAKLEKPVPEDEE